MNKQRLTTTVGVLASACALLNASAIQAAQYHVDVNTSPLIGNINGPFYLDFQLNFGSGSGNSATINNFTYSSGASTGVPTLFGTASGDLSSSASLWADGTNPFNEIFQGFTPGSSLGFNISLSSNPTGVTPDVLAFAILDSSTFQIPTTDPLGLSLAQWDITGTGISVNAFSGTTGSTSVGGFTTFSPITVDYSGVTVTITAVPEASTSMVGFAALGMIATGIYRARRSVKQTA